MKIDLTQLSEAKEVDFQEFLEPVGLDLEVSGMKILSPIEIKAMVFKFRDNLDIKMDLRARTRTQCSRCLRDVELIIQKGVRLNFPISNQDVSIDLAEDIRQEIILDYPVKSLCKPSCNGLCVKCGKNLNEGSCSCRIS